jgi:hypothetical protein
MIDLIACGVLLLGLGCVMWGLCHHFYRRGWEARERAARERQQRIELRKTIDLERERQLRRRLRRDPDRPAS